MRRTRILAAVCGVALAIGTISPMLADAPPPTNGGNGGGHSGQCTGDPASRPAVCPAT